MEPGKRRKGRKTFRFVSLLTTLLVTLSAILGKVAGYISPVCSSWMSLFALLLPCSLILCLICFIYWAAHMRYRALLPLIALLINWGFFASMIQNPFRNSSEQKTNESFKIATFNVGRFGGDDSGLNARRIAFFMAEEQVDIICFQEFTQGVNVTYDSLDVIFNSWKYSISTYQKERDLLPLTVYSRYPIVNSGFITFPNTANNSMWVDVLIHNKRIRVFNNHLQTTNINQHRNNIESSWHFFVTNDKIRAIQAAQIKRLVEKSPYPVLVVGDLNSTPSSYVYHTTKGALKDGFRSAGHGWGYTFRFFKRLLRIDYVFHSPFFKGLDYYSSDLDLGSDHNPVIMELETGSFF